MLQKTERFLVTLAAVGLLWRCFEGINSIMIAAAGLGLLAVFYLLATPFLLKSWFSRQRWLSVSAGFALAASSGAIFFQCLDYDLIREEVLGMLLSDVLLLLIIRRLRFVSREGKRALSLRLLVFVTVLALQLAAGALLAYRNYPTGLTRSPALPQQVRMTQRDSVPQQ